MVKDVIANPYAQGVWRRQTGLCEKKHEFPYAPLQGQIRLAPIVGPKVKREKTSKACGLAIAVWREPASSAQPLQVSLEFFKDSPTL